MSPGRADPGPAASLPDPRRRRGRLARRPARRVYLRLGSGPPAGPVCVNPETTGAGRGRRGGVTLPDDARRAGRGALPGRAARPQVPAAGPRLRPRPRPHRGPRAPARPDMTGLEDQEFDFDFLFEFNQSGEGAAAAAPGGSARGREGARVPGAQGPGLRGPGAQGSGFRGAGAGRGRRGAGV